MFLPDPPASPAVEAAYGRDLAGDGYVNNNTRLWSYRPDVNDRFVEMRSVLMEGSTLSERELAVLLVAAVAVRSDSYCALAWGSRLAKLADADAATAVISGETTGSLTARENALAGWARAVARDANGTTPEDVAALRDCGLTDQEIFEATAYVAFRLAFSMVDDALGAEPDLQLAESAPPEVREAVAFGRRPRPRAERLDRMRA
jgi:uncharacterized peroxidase-related enzyme